MISYRQLLTFGFTFPCFSELTYPIKAVESFLLHLQLTIDLNLGFTVRQLLIFGFTILRFSVIP